MISQIPPKHSKGPTLPARVGPVRRASDLVRHHDQRVELRGFDSLWKLSCQARQVDAAGRCVGAGPGCTSAGPSAGAGGLVMAALVRWWG
jgi:hypothetical protein